MQLLHSPVYPELMSFKGRKVRRLMPNQLPRPRRVLNPFFNTKKISIQAGEVRALASEIMTYILSFKALSPDNDPKAKERTQKFLETLAAFSESDEPLQKAEERLRQWKAEPKPFNE